MFLFLYLIWIFIFVFDLAWSGSTFIRMEMFWPSVARLTLSAMFLLSVPLKQFVKHSHKIQHIYKKNVVCLSHTLFCLFGAFISNWHEKMQRRHYFCWAYAGFLSQSCNPFIIQTEGPHSFVWNRKSVKMDFNYKFKQKSKWPLKKKRAGGFNINTWWSEILTLTFIIFILSNDKHILNLINSD